MTAKARADAQEHVWNDIWKRRIVYFATVGATLWLLVFPLISGAQRADEFNSPIRWVSDIIRFVGGFLPGFASTWVDGYARAPLPFLLLSGLVAVFIWLGNENRHADFGPHGFDLARNRLPRRRVCRTMASTGFAATGSTSGFTKP